MRSLATSPDEGMLPLTIGLMSAYLKNNEVPADKMGSLISEVHNALLESAEVDTVVDGIEIPHPFFSKSSTVEEVDVPETEEGISNDLSSLMTSLGLSFEAVRFTPASSRTPASFTPKPQKVVELRQAELPLSQPEPQVAPRRGRKSNRVYVNGHPLPSKLKTIDDAIQMKHIICFEDGKKVKDLASHLESNHKMTPSQYLSKWGLPPEYPMVAPNAILTSGQVFEVDFSTGSLRKV